jgi:hypothetical protein
MARLIKSRGLEPVINAAQEWVQTCLIADNSVFSDEALWTPENVAEVRRAFVEHPQEGKDNFFTKLKGQMESASASAKRLMAEMIWALLLFPTNIKISTKRQQVVAVWSMSGERLREDLPLLSNEVLSGIGSGGTGFNNHRWRELVFLISLVGDLKQRSLVWACVCSGPLWSFRRSASVATTTLVRGAAQIRHWTNPCFGGYGERRERKGDRHAKSRRAGSAGKRSP